MPFAEADYVNATQGNQFINDLMPKYPVYLSLLPKNARDVVGIVNAASEPAKLMLERQGFKYNGYVDIFDGGPTLTAERDSIGVVKDSHLYVVSKIVSLPEGIAKYMVTNENFAGFRCGNGRIEVQEDGTLHITPRLAARINVQVGSNVRCYPL